MTTKKLKPILSHVPTAAGYGEYERKINTLRAAALNDLNRRQAQRPVSPFAPSGRGWLTFDGGEEIRRLDDGCRISGSAADALNALWDGNGEHDAHQ